MFVFYALLPYAYYSFLQWVKFCSGCFRQVFFIWDIKKVVAGHMFDWWSFYTVTIYGNLLGQTQRWSYWTSGCRIEVVF